MDKQISPDTGSWSLHRQPADQIADHEFSIWRNGQPIVLANVMPGEEGVLATIVATLNAAGAAPPPAGNAGAGETTREIWMRGYWAAVNEIDKGDMPPERHAWYKSAYERNAFQISTADENESK